GGGAGAQVRCRIGNTTTDTPKGTSTACHRRRRMYDFIQLRGPRNGPRTPPSLRRRVPAGRAPLSRARSCSPCPRPLEMAPALPHPCAGASLPDTHRCRALDHALPPHLPSKCPPHSPLLPPARPRRTHTPAARSPVLPLPTSP